MHICVTIPQLLVEVMNVQCTYFDASYSVTHAQRKSAENGHKSGILLQNLTFHAYHFMFIIMDILCSYILMYIFKIIYNKYTIYRYVPNQIRGFIQRIRHRLLPLFLFGFHYSDFIMGAMVSQNIGVSIVCSTVGSGSRIKEIIKTLRHWPL